MHATPIQRSRSHQFTTTPPQVQAKLEVGKPNDKYEQQADAVANRVMGMSTPGVQMMPNDAMPELQMMGMKEEEEKGKVQMMPEEDEKVQMMPEEDEKVQMMEEEDEKVQMKCDDCEEKVQRQPALQQQKDGAAYASNDISSKLNSKKGTGHKLSEETQAELGQKMGANLSEVNIHTDSEAVQLTSQMGAQAFTHGGDIYFNEGKYNPHSAEGKHLLVHELTHTVQQGATPVGGGAQQGAPEGVQRSPVPELQMYSGCSSTEDSTINSDVSRALSFLNVAIAKLASYDGTNPSKVHDALNDHFNGATSRAFGYWIMTNLLYLRGMAWMAGYQCKSSCSGTTRAIAYWCVPFMDIRLCPRYFSTSSASERSRVIIHEWVHKYGCNFDTNYEWEDGYDDSWTITQLINADSWAHFVQDVQ